MKQFLAASLLLLSLAPVFAQERTYFDKYHDKVKPKEAVYYQTTTIVNEAGGSRYFVETYYMSDTLQSAGYYSDKKLTVKDGSFAYYRDNGQKKQEEAYTDGKLNGRYVEYFRNNSVSEEKFYNNGKLEGKSVHYYETGTVLSERFFRDGKLHGDSRSYHENGKLAYKVTYVNDLKTGDAFEYFDDGLMGGEEHYVDGRLHGECRWFFRNGQVSSIEQYAAGKLLRFELFNENGSRDTVSKTPGEGPEYPGGMTEMRRFLANNIRYPQIAKEQVLQGRLYLIFTITPQGKIKNIDVVKGVEDCPECDAEGIRVIGLMPDWVPSKSHNRWVDQSFNLPITYTLQ